MPEMLVMFMIRTTSAGTAVKSAGIAYQILSLPLKTGLTLNVFLNSC
jgi:hypothetical protein